MRKKIFLGFLFSVFVLGGVYHRFLIESVASILINGYGKFNQSLINYDELTFKKGTFHLKNVSILDLRNQNSVVCQIESERISFRLGFKNQLEIHAPKITLLRKTKHLKTQKDSFSFQGLKNWNILLEKGILQLVDLTEKGMVHQEIGLELWKLCDETTLSFNIRFPNECPITCHFFPEEENLSMHIKNCNLSHFLKLGKFFTKQSFITQIKHLEGKIDGTICLGKENYFNFKAEKFYLESKEYNGSFDQAVFSGKYFPDHQPHNWGFLKKLQLEWLNKLSLQSAIENGFFSFLTPENQLICLQNFILKTSMHMDLGPKWDFKGKLKLNEDLKDFSFSGKGCFHSTFSNWFQSKAHLAHYDKPFFLNLKVTQSDFDDFSIHTNLQNLQKFEFSLVRPFYDFLKDWELQKGNISTNFRLSVVDGEMQDVTFEYLTLNQLECKNSIAFWGVDHVSLQGNCSNTQKQAEDATSGKMEIKNARVHIKDQFFENIHSKVQLEKGVFSESYVDFQLEQLKGEMDIKGHLLDIISTLQLQGKLPLVSNLWLHNSTENPFKLSASFHLTENEWECDFDSRLGNDHMGGKFGIEPMQFLTYAPYVEFKKGEFWIEDAELSRYKNFLPLENAQGKIQAKTTLQNCQWEILVTAEDLKIQHKIFDFQVPYLKNAMILFKPNQLNCAVEFSESEVFLKPFSLQFTKFDGALSFADNQLFIHVKDTYSHELELMGDVVLDFANEKQPYLFLQTQKAVGRCENITKFLKQFSLDLPSSLKGDFISSDAGVILYTQLNNPSIPVDWQIKGEVHNGYYPIHSSVNMNDISCAFSYDSSDHNFSIERLAAEFQTKNHSYEFFLKYLQKHQKHWEYDLALSKGFLDYINVKGKALENDGSLVFSFEPEKTKFWNHQLQVRECVYQKKEKSWSFDFNTRFQARQLLEGLQFIVDCGIGTIEKLPHIEVKGELELAVQNSLKHSNVQLSGKNFTLHDEWFDKIQFSASRVEDLWNVQHFQLGDLHGSLEFCSKKNAWFFENFHLNYQDHVHLVSQGNLDPQCFLEAQMNQIVCDLKKPVIYPSFLNFLTGWEGKLNGSGKCAYDLFTNKAKLDVSLKPFSLRAPNGLHLKNISPMEVGYSSVQGITFGEIDLNCFFKNSEKPIQAKVEKIEMQWVEKKWKAKQAKVSITDEINTVGKTIFGLSAEIPVENPIQFTADAEVSLDGSNAHIVVGEIDIPLFNRKTHLESLDIQLNQKASLCDFNVFYREKPFHIQSLLKLEDHLTGVLKVTHDLIPLESHETPLEIIWSYVNETLQIQNIQGALCGLDASFHLDESYSHQNPQQYTGGLKIDFYKAQEFLPKDYQDMVSSLELGEGYEFKGTLQYDLVKEGLIWDGIFSGKNCELFGFEFKTLMTKIYVDDALKLRGFKLSDSSGIMKIESLDLTPLNKTDVKIVIPKLFIKEFRPSFLHHPGKKPGEIEPLVVRNLHLNDFEGVIGKKETFTGSGNLYFINSFKRGYTVFDIPSDLLGRIIGLDQELLIPVNGKIQFSIHDGKCYLDDLTEAYSLNNRSEFFFDPNLPKPTIDLGGKLEIFVKMKQYVLFKFTENFILSIQGRVDQPEFHLNRKRKFKQKYREVSP